MFAFIATFSVLSVLFFLQQIFFAVIESKRATERAARIAARRAAKHQDFRPSQFDKQIKELRNKMNDRRAVRATAKLAPHGFA